MRKIAYLLCLTTCLCFNGCQDGPGVDIPFQVYITIPAGLNTGLTHHFPIENINGVNFDNLADAQPSYVTISTEYGEPNLDFIWQAFFIAIDGNTVQEMAYQTDLLINNYASEQLFPSILNMSNHITQPTFDMELKMIFRAIPVTETRIRIDFGVRGILEG